MPAGAAPAPGPVHLEGKCEVLDDTHLFMLMDLGSSMSINCEGATVDWSREIAFLQNSDGGPLLIFRGKRGRFDTELIVDQVENLVGLPEPAKGRCLLFHGSDEPAAPRTIECFARISGKSGPSVTHIRFVAADPMPVTGAVIRTSGRCERVEAMDVVLLAGLEQEAQKELPPVHSPPLACDLATSVTGESVTFSQGDRPDTRVRFSGKPGREGTRLVIDSIAFGDRPPVEAILGTCLSMRMPDGQLQTSCGAAYREGAETRFISTAFTPQGTK